MKKLLLGVCAIALMAGCTKKDEGGGTTPEPGPGAGNPIVCAIQQSATSLVASSIATALTCKNLEAVKASVDEQANKLNLCKKAEEPVAKGALGTVICGPLVDAVAGLGLSALPDTWQCTGGETLESVKAKVLEACKKAI